MKQQRFALVYQAGIANVFKVDCWNLQSFGRNAMIVLQGDFRTCETFTNGLAYGKHLVESFACNMAGDIANQPWNGDLDSAPFHQEFRPVIQRISAK
jgi:hypothetical protein